MKDRIEELALHASAQLDGDCTVIVGAITTAVNEALELAAMECDHWQSLSATHKCGEQMAYVIRKLKVAE